MIEKRKLLPFLALVFSLSAFTGTASAQGWSFTFDLVVTGPCGGYVPPIPPFTVTTMPTQSTCESLRSAIASIRVSQPMYDNNGHFIGDCTAYYSVSGCTGSDLAGMANGAPGSVSIDALLQGYPFFSPHDTKVLEDWYSDFLVKLRSMGVEFGLDNFLTVQEIPLTGDVTFDEMYATQLNMFANRPAENSDVIDNTQVVDLTGKEGVVDPAALQKPSDGMGTTVGLLTTEEEQRKRDEWMAQNGFNDMTQAGIDNSIDAGGEEKPKMSWSEAGLRALIGQSSGAANIASDFMLNTLDETTSGINGVVSDLASGNDAQALAKAENLSETVAFNAVKKTGINYISGLIAEDGLGKALFPAVSGAEAVYKVAKFGNDTWENRTGKTILDN